MPLYEVTHYISSLREFLLDKKTNSIEEDIKYFGIQQDKQRHSFEIRDKGEAGYFIGIFIELQKDLKHYQLPQFKLSQTDLTNKVNKESHLSDFNPSKTPSQTVALVLYRGGVTFSEYLEYASIMGMRVFLSNNYRPDIYNAVHQCARFTHFPKSSQGSSVKFIIRYFQVTKDKGLVISPIKNLLVDLQVDAKLYGFFNVEHDQDTTCVKSHTWYIIMFMNFPLLLTSKLQTQISLCTMEAMNILLLKAMRKLDGVHELIK